MASPSTIQSTTPTDPHHYPHRIISFIAPGPIRVRFTGIVVNIFGYGIDSTAPKAAKGCLKLLLKDSSGEILVKLWYAEAEYGVEILLGSRLSVSTTHISTTASPGMDAGALRALPACIMTSIFPERDAGCAIQIHAVDGDESNGASEVVVGTNLNGLMNLEAFVNGAADDKFREDVKLLVCVVGVGDPVTSRSGRLLFGTRSIIWSVITASLTTSLAEKLTSYANLHLVVPTREGGSFQVIPVQILDASTTTTHTQIGQIPFPTPTLIPVQVELSLSSHLVSSTRSFTPTQTILLLTSPKLHSQSRRKIKLTHRSQIFVDPAHPETLHLRQWISNLYPACNISSSEIDRVISRIEEGKSPTRLSTTHRGSTAVFTPGSGLTFHPRKSPHRKQFTWSLFTNQITLQPNTAFTAYISVIITRLSLVDLWQRNELFCMPCPHHPGKDIYSNSPIDVCEDRVDINDDVNAATITSETEMNERKSDRSLGGEARLRFNPLLLSGVSDETGGFLVAPPLISSSSSSFSPSLSPALHSKPINTKTTTTSPSPSSHVHPHSHHHHYHHPHPRHQPQHQNQHHNIYLSNKATHSLTGLTSDAAIFSPPPGSTPETENPHVTARLREIESSLLYRRVTLVVGWSGAPHRERRQRQRNRIQIRQGKEGGVVESGKREEGDEGEDEEMKETGMNRVIVLDVLS